MIPRLVVVAALAASFSCACQGEPRRLGWELEFATSDLLEDARHVQARIRQGSCTGEVAYTVEIPRVGMAMAPEAPTLPDGDWAFEGRAFTSTCQFYAEGCTDVTLPTPGPVVVSMRMRTTVIPACPMPMCNDGSCMGGSEGGVTPDASGGRDGGPCAGCFDGTTCVAGTDASACGSGGGPCADCGECGSCDGSACVPMDGVGCMGAAGICRAGACCTGCWDGSMCRVGNEGLACGAGGETCMTCPDCEGCMAGACGGVAADGARCSLGLCRGAPPACCAGCWNGSVCAGGTIDIECGMRGVPCTACVVPQVCTAGTCS